MGINELEEKGLSSYKARANEYLKDKKKSLGLLDKALRKANTHRNALGEAWESFQLELTVRPDGKINYK